jgi:hypothetical protein
MGAGLAAFGVMLDIWGLSALWIAALPPLSWRDPDTEKRRLIPTMLAVVSLVCLATATVAFFPPWQIGTSASATAFHATWLLGGTLLALPVTRGAMRRWGLPGVILSAILAGWLSLGSAVGISMALIFSLFAASHILMLFSKEPFLKQTEGESPNRILPHGPPGPFGCR